jgi:hypothetical protein
MEGSKSIMFLVKERVADKPHDTHHHATESSVDEAELCKDLLTNRRIAKFHPPSPAETNNILMRMPLVASVICGFVE